VLRSIAREYGWEEFLPAPHEIVNVDLAKLDEYLGRFQVNPDRVLKVTKDSEKLFGEATEAQRFELLPVSENTFVRRDQNVRYTFVKDTGGKVGSIKIQFPGGESQANRLSDDTLIPFEMLMTGRAAEAVEAYRKIRKENASAGAVSEGRLNNLGYTLMRQNKLAEAIAIFKLNVEFYPDAWNVYDSLGEAYMTSGDKELAIANYKKSLELNPKNSGGVQMLKKLEGK
jgi:tetratricopeptide (TPR) repeat protein